MDGLAYIDMPLTVRQLEQILAQVSDKDTIVAVNDETCQDAEITAVSLGDDKIGIYINGKVVDA